MLTLQAAEHVRHQSEDHGGVVILDTAAGMWMALNPTAGHFWRSWQSGAGFEEGVAEVAARSPGIPLESIRADAEDLVRDLCSRGLIEAVPPGVLAETAADMAEDPAADGLRPAWHLVITALLALVVASLFLRFSFRASLRLVRMTRGTWCRREASPRRAAEAVAAARRAAHWYPGRAACLEQSLAAVLVAAMRRRQLDWCLGSIPDPYRFHAWVEVAGRPVPAPQSGYSRILAV